MADTMTESPGPEPKARSKRAPETVRNQAIVQTEGNVSQIGRMGGRIGCIAGAGIAGLVVLMLVLGFVSGSVVQAGHVGVLLTWGRAHPQVLQPGFHLIFPMAQRIVQVETRVLPHNFKEIDAATKEYQSVKLTGTMNYHLEAARAAELYQNVGLDFADRVIDPAFNDFIKEVVPRYAVTEILIKRDEIRQAAKQALGANLERYGIVVDDIYLSNIAFSAEYQDAIEKKQTAQQNVETEQQILAQRTIQAQQRVAEAKGNAEAAIANAEGEARANQLRTASITPQLIDYLRWTRWDGRLPQVLSDSSPLLTMPVNQGQPAPSPTPATPR